MSGWLGVDLDGTLASSAAGEWEPAEHNGRTEYVYAVGPPIPLMVVRVKAELDAGRDVRIFTARAGHQPDGIDGWHIRRVIEAWCLEHLGRVLPITNVKDYTCEEIWDDRARQVIRNTGVLVGA